ncbi:MAG: IucA/IucC family C-terminal-domain containing protein [Legionella sp.]
MVKLSLAEEHGGVSRIVTRRECGLSVGNSAIFTQKLAKKDLNLTIFEEPLAYIPKGYEAGMIYRQLPNCLNPKLANEEKLYHIPLFSLHGIKNRDFFREIITVNGGNATVFLSKYFLSPFARIVIELLLYCNISIEAHAQNLLLVLDKDKRICSFLYRDMGGVNQLFTPNELSGLPMNLRDPLLYYFETHIQDASTALEHHFVIRGLCPLTRQLVKDPAMKNSDPLFIAWLAEAAKHNFLQNWTLENLDSDDYQRELPIHHFYRYGYVEAIFMECLMTVLQEKNWLAKIM